jgi:hypothetical protein
MSGAPPRHAVPRREPRARASCDWDGPQWRGIQGLEIASFHPAGSSHRPRTQARLAWDDAALHAIFRVEDRWVRCVHLDYQSPVYRDSCVELFAEPLAGRGYCNFELSCGGGLLIQHIEDPTRLGPGFARYAWIDAALGRTVDVATSLPGRIDPERPEPLVWTAALRIPFALFEQVVGARAPRPGATWRANLYKCADDSSHPHWGSWAPIGERREFHQPACFGELVFSD